MSLHHVLLTSPIPTASHPPPAVSLFLSRVELSPQSQVSLLISDGRLLVNTPFGGRLLVRLRVLSPPFFLALIDAWHSGLIWPLVDLMSSLPGMQDRKVEILHLSFIPWNMDWDKGGVIGILVNGWTVTRRQGDFLNAP